MLSFVRIKIRTKYATHQHNMISFAEASCSDG